MYTGLTTAPLYAVSQLASAVIHDPVKTGVLVSALVAIHSAPLKAEAKPIIASEWQPKIGAVIIFLPCVAACLAAGALMPLCVAFCTVVPG
jgi:hypothetical protein